MGDRHGPRRIRIGRATQRCARTPAAPQPSKGRQARGAASALGEEVAEFLEADENSAPEELADVLEVVRALAADLGVDADQLETIREAKGGERGGFADRIVWTGNR
ncbi:MULTISPECIES: nucleoside triphosphate pyrophosphohydrolase [Streptomyces]|uniref:nucleoside triphosphate pyrophosphohydrolase n=1 Tax=Streptomyces TaxID=1883 RepID=UPI0024730CBC|nr:nucleoside triphosphate pyrophosphohydrolase [Streptomyces durhamensis]